MNGTRWERKRIELKRKIVKIAIELFRTQGFNATTMEQIANKTDIARGTLYSNFSNKEAIIKEYMKLAVQESETQLTDIFSKCGDTYSRLLATLMEINKWNEAHKDILRMHTAYRLNELVSPQNEEITESSFEASLIRVILPAQKAGELRHDISALSLVRYLKALYSTYFLGWLLEDKKDMGRSEMEELVNLFLFGAQIRKD